MFTLTRTETYEQDAKKSRFIAFAGPVANEEAAKRFIAEYSDGAANHNCWAWRVGQNYRFSDDGEPSGTAGKPILQAIDGNELDGVAVVVIRWFGGILLGSGGLIRAYGGTAAICLKTAEKSAIIPMYQTSIECGFSDLALVKARLLSIENLSLDGESFGASGAELTLSIPVETLGQAAQMLRDITSGRVQLSLPE
ncbi:YigZ family protein [uncultured Agrobacterium sp.]|uniref:IMPACT family protein n=1 Tax=uncultured Agrobacterium sp. TaxID=157277 RepID=UPI00258B3E44|nr:YigZ family protein [uncultured Agrobacterium sp.]